MSERPRKESLEDRLAARMRGDVPPATKPAMDAGTLISGQPSRAPGTIEPARDTGRVPAQRGETLADRIAAMPGFKEATAKAAAPEPTAPEQEANTTENVMQGAMALLRAGSPRGFERMQRDRFAQREQARRELLDTSQPKPKAKADPEAKLRAAIENDRSLVERIPTSDWYLNLSNRAAERVDEVLSEYEIVVPPAQPTEHETASMNRYLEHGNEHEFGEEEEDDDFDTEQLVYVDGDGVSHSDEEFVQMTRLDSPEQEEEE
jgi:hypothetical protein